MISVIIPAYNEERFIERTLLALRAQGFKDYEIITVVDVRSSDNTARIARRYGKVIKQSSKGVSRARNEGTRYAKGDILYFLDADTLVLPGVLRRISSEFKDSRVAVVTGPITPLENVGYFIRFIFLMGNLSAHFTAKINRPSFTGSNMAVRTGIFKKAGGFNTAISTFEDIDFSLRAGRLGKSIFSNAVRVRSSARRIIKYGSIKFSMFVIANMIRYYIMRNPYKKYEHIS
ncbi:glycosyltransferase [Candidatus Parvarchaeota archaeon]|nr:glycosyltransferase [Candidatus Parvarchaeota archaeon]